jgi:ArsR family transcriptional regulator
VRDVAQFFKLLADEARIQMLWLLFNHRELCVCDLMAALDITQSKASRHLATLRHAGLVVDRREAAWSYYSLRAPASELERAVLDTLRAKLAGHPGASQALHDLHAWLEQKDRDAACAAGGACHPKAQGKAKSRARPALAGDTR